MNHNWRRLCWFYTGLVKGQPSQRCRISAGMLATFGEWCFRIQAPEVENRNSWWIRKYKNTPRISESRDIISLHSRTRQGCEMATIIAAKMAHLICFSPLPFWFASLSNFPEDTTLQQVSPKLQYRLRQVCRKPAPVTNLRLDYFGQVKAHDAHSAL